MFENNVGQVQKKMTIWYMAKFFEQDFIVENRL